MYIYAGAVGDNALTRNSFNGTIVIFLRAINAFYTERGSGVKMHAGLSPPVQAPFTTGH